MLTCLGVLCWVDGVCSYVVRVKLLRVVLDIVFLWVMSRRCYRPFGFVFGLHYC